MPGRPWLSDLATSSQTAKAANAWRSLRWPQPGEPSYSSLKRTPGPGRPVPRSANAAPQAGTRQYEPTGKRFTINRNALSYMGWTFQVRPACRLPDEVQAANASFMTCDVNKQTIEGHQPKQSCSE